MARILGFVSFMVILFCTDLICAAEDDSREQISLPMSEHFCTKVMSGRFEHIQLMNIDQLHLYEPDNRMLTCQVVSKEAKDDDQKLEYAYVTDEYLMTLNDTYEEWHDEAVCMPRWFQAHKQESGHIRRFYRFPLGVEAFQNDVISSGNVPIWKFLWEAAKVKVVYMAFTDRALYKWDLSNYYLFQELGDKLVKPQSKVTLSKDTAEVALLYKIENDTATGYVIQKDSQTGNFIIYDFMYMPDSQSYWSKQFSDLMDMTLAFRASKKRDRTKPEDLKLERKVYYFMKMTDNPHEIRLVHRDHANGSSADCQLFRDALPNGFQYNGSQYLFDGSLGCVYVVQHFEFNLTQQFEAGKVDIRLERLNIPYEQYFKCPDKYKLADDFAQRYRADRCDSVIGEDGSIDRDISIRLFWALLGLACLLFMTIIFVGVLIFWKKINSFNHKKKRLFGQNELESANKYNKTLTTSGTTEASGTTTSTTAVSSSADATVQSGTAK